MIATLGRWEIGTNASKHLRWDSIWNCRFEALQPEVSPSTLDPEQAAGEFIARHVLERDSVFFEG